jgi:hypothetical protein
MEKTSKKSRLTDSTCKALDGFDVACFSPVSGACPWFPQRSASTVKLASNAMKVFRERCLCSMASVVRPLPWTTCGFGGCHLNFVCRVNSSVTRAVRPVQLNHPKFSCSEIAKRVPEQAQASAAAPHMMQRPASPKVQVHKGVRRWSVTEIESRD